MLLLLSFLICSHFYLRSFILNILLFKLKGVTFFFFLFFFQFICKLKFIFFVLVFILSFFFSLYHVMILKLIFMHSVLHEKFLHRHIVFMRTVNEHFFVLNYWFIRYFWLFSHVFDDNLSFKSFNKFMVQKSKNFLFCFKILMDIEDLWFWGLSSSNEKTFELLR